MSMDQQYTDCLSELETVKAERDALAANLEKAERIAGREATGFRAMCEAFQNLEAIVGLDTGGGMGPGPALNAVESIRRERDALAAQLERLRQAGNRVVHYGCDKCEWDDAISDGHDISLAKRDAEQQKIGAASFRHEVMESVKPPFRPHIQGVFEVWLSRQAGGDA